MTAEQPPPHLIRVQNVGNVCGCLTCQEERQSRCDGSSNTPGMDRYFRFACEICGNKRCPHHTDHRLACTDSNERGQVGSAYE